MSDGESDAGDDPSGIPWEAWEDERLLAAVAKFSFRDKNNKRKVMWGAVLEYLGGHRTWSQARNRLRRIERGLDVKIKKTNKCKRCAAHGLDGLLAFGSPLRTSHQSRWLHTIRHGHLVAGSTTVNVLGRQSGAE